MFPAQRSRIFLQDYELFGKRLFLQHIDQYFGKKFILYGTMASSKTAFLLSEVNILEPFKKAGFEIVFFLPKLLKGIIDRPSSRAGVNFKGDVHFIEYADELLTLVGNSIHRKVVVGDEVEMIDSKIIDVAERLRSQGMCVILSGLDLSFRGEYFPFTDSASGKTMEDLISSFPRENRFPLYAFCTAKLPNDAICMQIARFPQRLHEDSSPAPWHEPLIKFEKDSYESRCAQHLLVPHRTIPEFIQSVVLLEPPITPEELIALAFQRKQDTTVVRAVLERMLKEHHVYLINEKLYPCR